MFQCDDDFYQDLVHNSYKPACESILQKSEKDDAMDLLTEAIDEEEFRTFVEGLFKIVLHVELSDPPLTIAFEEDFDFRIFRKSDFYCIDGFPKEGLPCVVVFPTPMRDKWIYQTGLLPAVITLPEASDEIKAIAEAKDKEMNKTKEDKRKVTEEPVIEIIPEIEVKPPQMELEWAKTKLSLERAKSENSLEWAHPEVEIDVAKIKIDNAQAPSLN